MCVRKKMFLHPLKNCKDLCVFLQNIGRRTVFIVHSPSFCIRWKPPNMYILYVYIIMYIIIYRHETTVRTVHKRWVSVSSDVVIVLRAVVMGCVAHCIVFHRTLSRIIYSCSRPGWVWAQSRSKERARCPSALKCFIRSLVPVRAPAESSPWVNIYQLKWASLKRGRCYSRCSRWHWDI